MADTFASKGWKPMREANPAAPYAFIHCIDNGGVVKFGYGVTRNGETFASADISTIASAAEASDPLGYPVRIMDITSPPAELDFDSTAGDNDLVTVAPLGSGHVVTAMVLSAQGDLTAGALMKFSTITTFGGELVPFTAAAGAGDSIQLIRDDIRSIAGRLAEDCVESDADPKVAVLCSLRLAV